MYSLITPSLYFLSRCRHSLSSVSAVWFFRDPRLSSLRSFSVTKKSRAHSQNALYYFLWYSVPSGKATSQHVSVEKRQNICILETGADFGPVTELHNIYNKDLPKGTYKAVFMLHTYLHHMFSIMIKRRYIGISWNTTSFRRTVLCRQWSSLLSDDKPAQTCWPVAFQQSYSGNP